MSLEDHQFQPGQPKTPGSGRKLGTRNKLSERFLKDLHDEWERSGSDCLKILAKEDPAGFARLALGILPKEFEGVPPPVTIITGVARGDETPPIGPPSFRAPPAVLPPPKKPEPEAVPMPLTSEDMVAPLPKAPARGPARAEPAKPVPIEYPDVGWR